MDEVGPTTEPKGDLQQWLRNFAYWEYWHKTEHLEQYKTFNIDMPVGFLDMLDAECAKRGISRQPLVKYVLYEWLRHNAK